MSEQIENLDDAIRQNAAGPKSAEVDGQKVEQHSLKDQIAADEYLAKKKAARNPLAALHRTKLCPPGA